jgi:hypothetical protein
MQPYIDINFYCRAEDLSLVSAVHRWGARFEAMQA